MVRLPRGLTGYSAPGRRAFVWNSGPLRSHLPAILTALVLIAGLLTCGCGATDTHRNTETTASEPEDPESTTEPTDPGSGVVQTAGTATTSQPPESPEVVVGSTTTQPMAAAPIVFPAGPRQPQWPLKTDRTLFTDTQLARVRQLCSSNVSAIALKDRTVADAAYWVAMPDEQLYQVLPDSRVPRAMNVSSRGCPVHGMEIYQHGTYPWTLDRTRPFEVTCPVGGETYPSNDFGAYYADGMQNGSLLTGNYADDGRGWVAPDGDSYWFVGYACHWHWRGTWLPAVTTLSRAYAMTGDPVYAQKAIVMLDRIAEFYPAMSYKQQSRMGGLVRSGFEGKVLNSIWETWTLRDLAIAYDLVFDVLIGTAPWSPSWRAPNEIRAHIEANLLEEGIAAVADKRILGNYGMHQSALAHAVSVRQHGPTQQLLGGIFNATGGALTDEGLNYALYNFVFKDGMPFETAPGYCRTWVENFNLIGRATAPAGFDIYQHPRIPLALDMPLNLLCNAWFTPANGDALTINSAWILPNVKTYEDAYRRLGKPAYAWTLRQRHALVADFYDEFDELLRQPLGPQATLDAAAYQPRLASRVFDGYGMAILNSADDTAAVSLYYGLRGGHGHWDRLNIEVFGQGRRLSPDLGMPDFVNGYTPGRFSWTSNTVSHNTVMVDQQRQANNLHGRVLRFHDSLTVDVVDVEAAGTYGQSDRYRRTLVLVDVGNDDAYLVDVFRVRGGNDHVMSIHGQEGAFDLAGASLSTPSTQGTLAGPTVTYGELYDDPVRSDPGYSGPYRGYSGSGYSHLFNWQSAQPNQTAIARWALAGDPATQLRVHIPPHPGQEIVVADAYVSPTRKIPAILKYVLLRRTGDVDGNAFVNVWELSPQPIIDQVTVNNDPALGTGSDRTVVLSVRRGNVEDTIAIAMDGGSNYAATVDLTTDAAVMLWSVENGQLMRLFAAGGSHVTGTQPAVSAAIPPTVTGTIMSADYAGKSISVDIGGAAVDPATLVGFRVRIFNSEHSSIYTIAAGSVSGSTLTLALGGSDVLTGRVKLGAVDQADGTIATPTNVLYPFNMAGMHLATEDLATAVRIVSMQNGVFTLAPGASLAGFEAGLNAQQDAFVADFGGGDQIEIERRIHQ